MKRHQFVSSALLARSLSEVLFFSGKRVTIQDSIVGEGDYVMATQRILQFPDGFLWGTASSSYQCEGGNTNNQWYRWEQEGHILTGETCGEADNWWENAERDFDLAEQIENNALRLSLEWSRIEPEEGRWDSAA